MGRDEDRARQQELYEKYASVIFRRCQRYLHSKEEAQDATSDIFLKLLEHWDSVQNRESALFWIHRTTTNHCITLWRRKKFLGPDNEDGWENSPLHADDSVEKRIILRDILNKLLFPWNKKVREIIMYTYWDGYTQDEISSLTGIAPSTIRKYLTKFRRQAPYFGGPAAQSSHAALVACHSWNCSLSADSSLPTEEIGIGSHTDDARRY